jgi:hypothetical protein
MPTVTLPSGHTVELRDPASLKRKDRKALLFEVASLPDGTPDFVRGITGMEVLLRTAISGWSFDVPVTAEALDDLSLADDNALQAAFDEWYAGVRPDFSPSVDAAGRPVAEPGTPSSPSSR